MVACFEENIKIERKQKTEGKTSTNYIATTTSVNFATTSFSVAIFITGFGTTVI